MANKAKHRCFQIHFYFAVFWVIGFPTIAQSSANVSINLTLNSVALLGIAPSNSSIAFTFSSPTNAGNGFSTLTNTTKWLNFTSAVAPNVSRRITAQVINGSVPSGMSLSLNATAGGSMSGTYGSSTGNVTLSSSATTVVNGIGGAFTGTGASTGYNLIYSLSITNYASVRQGNYSFSIVYTLIDN